jgi:putative DNA methylase
MHIRKKLIEVSLPLEAINVASKKQKAPKGYPTSLHTYWAPRPLAACRGILFAQLVGDPSAWPEHIISCMCLAPIGGCPDPII